ncbi:MAG: cobalt ECF transporter T component CbiQ [Candidatus Omnitrophica bacterium]|nr:cobalt ECF transporter T component CbiQ [Candidatus Omnitrophota bacterium]MCG2703863.1 cobalt ECF transporter T component CbiQ [Candidatus Omnitrophota bacterium]
MNSIGKNYFDIGYMDTLAEGESSLHRLDPRAKLITTAAFIIAVISFDKYTLSGLTPFFIYPAVLIAVSGLPAGYILKKVLLVSPFAVVVGIFNPLMDRSVLLHIGSLDISGGWISFFSILGRFVLTVTAALILIALTGFNAVCRALTKLGIPKPFVVQLLFFYRYIFVLSDEAERMVRARSLRAFQSSGMRFPLFISFVGQLLLRTLDRAQRIYLAMCCRGFDGQIRMIKSMSIRHRDIVFVSVWLAIFVFLRYVNVPLYLGGLLMGVGQ